MIRASTRPRRLRGGLLAMALVLLSSTALLAHGGRLPLAFWGLFPPRVTECQRAISRALDRCAVTALQLRIRCERDKLSGGACDEKAIEAAIDGARIEALDTIDARCTDQLAIQLGFLGAIEVEADISNACARSHERLVSALYPASGPGASVELDSCKHAAGDLAPRLLRHATRAWEFTFNRIARRNLTCRAKRLALDTARRRIVRAREDATSLLSASCAGSVAQEAFGRTLNEVLGEVARESECLAGAAYVQNGVHCDPTPPPANPCGAG